jgi:uncharacterized protein
MDWNENVLASRAAVWALLRRTKRVAVLGVRPERMAFKPAHYLPAALQAMGLEIVPVPVVDRDVSEILGRTVYRALADVPEPIDIVNVFRRAGDIPAHVADILAAQPYAVWLQSGIRNDDVAAQLAQAGIRVVQDRCLMVDYRHFLASA